MTDICEECGYDVSDEEMIFCLSCGKRLCPDCADSHEYKECEK